MNTFYSLFVVLHEKLNQCNCSKVRQQTFKDESKAERLKIIGNNYIFQSETFISTLNATASMQLLPEM